MAEDLVDRLKRFLDPFVPHESGWVKPSKEDFQEFYDLCCAIRDAKWARDEDNDPTVAIDMVDRSVGRRPWVPVIPYIDYRETLTDEHWRTAHSLLDASANLAREAGLIIAHHRDAITKK